MQRRNFLTTAAAAIAAGTLPNFLFADEMKKPLFDISLAEWSLHRSINQGKLTNLDFPKYAKEKFGITAVEYVTGFFKDKAKDKAYLTDLKKRAADLGVKNVLIMVDGEGHLGAGSEKGINETVDKHKKWVEAAQFLGCHSIRVNAHGAGNREEQAKRVQEGLTKLSTFAKPHNINVIVENHGGLSSDPSWVESVIKAVNLPNCGTLPDFGNFHSHDRYQGIQKFMPFAKGVSAKSHAFNEAGEETKTDFTKAMKIVLDAGYRGHVGVEWEGGKISEDEGIIKTRDLLIKVREKLTPNYK